jgi:cell division protein FtsB
MNLLKRGKGNYVSEFFGIVKRISDVKLLLAFINYTNLFYSQILLVRWLQDIDRKQAELVAAQIALEKLRQRDQLLKTENELLRVED